MTPVAVTKAAGTPTPSGRRHWLRDADWECSVPALGGRVETVPLPAGDAADEAGDQTAVPVLLPGDRNTKGNLSSSEAAWLCGMCRSTFHYYTKAVLQRETAIGGE